MVNCNPMLLCDFYKACHNMMLPENITKSVSYFTPRGTRIEGWNEVVFFGLQYFIKEYLDFAFKNYFFNEDGYTTYCYTMDDYFAGKYDKTKIKALYDLGYLPIEIHALPEGAVIPVGVPLFSITNTHPDFAWLPQALESMISASMWFPIVAATMAKHYRDIVNKWYYKTCDNNVSFRNACGNFDFRGEDSVEAGIVAGMAWTLFFNSTASVPSLYYLEKNYPITDAVDEQIFARLYGSPSTEHAVMCSNYAIDGDEETFLRRLLTEIYPTGSVSAVLDSYDYWNVIDNILPKLKDIILNRNGTFLCRGDSGDCVEVITKTVFKLWDIFGGTINNKGYKVLDPHVKAIYGDSITLQRAEKIYSILEQNGFAANNVVLGVGSFSFRCVEQDGILKPFTRDTFNFAIKATYFETADGKNYSIYKAPKEADFKKSHKGCVRVFYRNKEYDKKDCLIESQDCLTYDEAYGKNSDNMLIPIYKDGEFVQIATVTDFRLLQGGKLD